MVGTIGIILIVWKTLDNSAPIWIVDIMIWLFAVWAFLYVFITMLASGTFATKMMKLTDLRRSSIHIQNIDSAQDLKLNASQMKMIESVTRYCSLLDISILSSMIALIIVGVIGYMMRYTFTMEFFQISYIVISINCVVNVLCLYLQNSFANTYYERFCVGVHRCWRFMLTKKAKQLLMKRYQKVIEENNDTDQEETQQMTPLKTTNT